MTTEGLIMNETRSRRVATLSPVMPPFAGHQRLRRERKDVDAAEKGVYGVCRGLSPAMTTEGVVLMIEKRANSRQAALVVPVGFSGSRERDLFQRDSAWRN